MTQPQGSVSRAVQPCRILVVAPYAGLANSVRRVANEYQNIQLSCITGNLNYGLRAARMFNMQNFDIVLSRGGTAGLLRQELNIPVLDIPIGSFDILKAIKLAQEIKGKKAIVGFPAITNTAATINEILQLNLDIYTLSEADDISEIVQLLVKKHYQTVLCDVVSGSAARAAGLDAVLITSGANSIRQAFNSALTLADYLRQANRDNRLLQETLYREDNTTLAFSPKGSILFASHMSKLPQGLVDYLRIQIPYVKNGSVQNLRKAMNGILYHVSCAVLYENGTPGADIIPEPTINDLNFDDALIDNTVSFKRDDKDIAAIVFYIHAGHTTSKRRRSGITYYTSHEAQRCFEGSLYNLSGNYDRIQSAIENANEVRQPLLITGEYGTGRTAVALETYATSPFSSRPFTEVDCGMLTESSQDFLLNSSHSPLFAQNETIHIKNFDSSSNQFLHNLFSTIAQAGTYQNMRVVFSCNPLGHTVQRYISYIKDKFLCMEVELIPLREIHEQIPTIANLYLSQLNSELTGEVLRIDHKAMDLLSAYAWPGNYIQFGRIIRQLYLSANDHVIDQASVRSALALERPTFLNRTSTVNTYGSLYRDDQAPSNKEGSSLSIPFGSLAQMGYDAACLAIRYSNGNQTEAAKKLGISRTTLWRILKKHEEKTS